MYYALYTICTISINSLTNLQEGQFDGLEQPKVSLTLFQPRIDKSEHDN